MSISAKPVRITIAFAAVALVAIGPLRTKMLAQAALPRLVPDSVAPAEVMILGVFHFHNPNADYAKFKGIDILSAERQEQIGDLVRRLGTFRPTVVAVEEPPAEGEALQAEFDRWRRGERQLDRNEVHQVGFRLAALMHLPGLVPIDHPMPFRADSLMGYAARYQPAMVPQFTSYIEAIEQVFDSLQANATLRANLLFLNEPANVTDANAPYAWFATLGTSGERIGAAIVSKWYERNLAMFANLAAAARPGERVLLIVGAGHVPIIRDLVIAHPGMRFVSPVPLLQ